MSRRELSLAEFDSDSTVAVAFHDPAGLGAQRARLVAYCTRLTGGDVSAAEDMTQEALTIAWEKREQIRGAEALAPFLASVARNLYLRRRRRIIRDGGRLAPLEQDMPDPFTPDPLAQIEQEDAGRILERAMEMIPTAAQDLLVERYVEDRPLPEVAARHGIAVGTAAVQLFRGREALRRALLSPALRPEALALGLMPPDAEEGVRQSDGVTLTETRVWCPFCGRRRLLGFVGEHSPECYELRLCCPDCDIPAQDVFQQSVFRPGIRTPNPLLGVRGFKPALNRIMGWWHHHIEAVSGKRPTCPHCSSPSMQVCFRVPADFKVVQWRGKPGLFARCDRCEHFLFTDFARAALYRPEARQFWRDHPRLRLLPPREVASAQGALLVQRLEDVAGSSALEVVLPLPSGS